MNIVQKIIFYLWFLCTLALSILYLMFKDGPTAPGVSVLESTLVAELLVTLVLGVPLFLFGPRSKKLNNTERGDPDSRQANPSIDLFELSDHPGRIAVGSAGKYIVGGTFFLDFSRQVTRYKRWRIFNWCFGPTEGYLVPVVHQGEVKGGWVISITKEDPCFCAVLPLWTHRFGEKPPVPALRDDGLKVIADFALTFPQFSGTPKT